MSTKLALHLVLLSFCLVRAGLAQDGQSVTSWPSVTVGMEKQEALRKIKASGCDVAEVGIQGSSDTAGILVPRDSKAGDVSGTVYFRGNKVVGIARDESGSEAAEVYENGMILFRLLSNITHEEQRVATVRTTTLEATTGTTRYIKLAFGSGKQVNIELNNPDPSEKKPQTVILSECEGINHALGVVFPSGVIR